MSESAKVSAFTKVAQMCVEEFGRGVLLINQTPGVAEEDALQYMPLEMVEHSASIFSPDKWAIVVEAVQRYDPETEIVLWIIPAEGMQRLYCGPFEGMWDPPTEIRDDETLEIRPYAPGSE